MAGIVNQISDIPQMQVGDTLNCVKGVIKQVMAVKKDKGKNPKWSFQTVVIHDRNGNEAKVKIWGREEIGKGCVGKEIQMVSGRDANNKQCGLFIKEDTYQGATSNIINCSETAAVIIPGVMGAVENQQQEEPPAQNAKTQSAPATASAPQNSGKVNPEDAVKHAKKVAYKIANLWSIAFVAATQRRVEMAEQLGSDLLTEEQFQAMVSTICIQLEREGMHHALPVQNIDVRPKEKTKAQQ